MKTLYILTKGLSQPDLATRTKLEEQDLLPRRSYLEQNLDALVLDEQHLANTKGILGWIYRRLPVTAGQWLEAVRLAPHVDVIFSHTEKVGLPLALALKWLRIRTPHVLTIWRITSEDSGQAARKAWLMRHTRQAFEAIVVWSSSQCRILVEELGVPRRNVHWVRYGVDLNFWRPMDVEAGKPREGGAAAVVPSETLGSQADVAPQASDIPRADIPAGAASEPADSDNAPMICSVGMEMRDYPTLVQALQGTGIRCHIATGTSRGELFGTVRRLFDLDSLPDGLTIGKRSFTELRDLYAQSRFVVIPLLPTDSDNGLTTMVEAMAMGKAVICSKVEGQVDILTHGLTGFYVPQGDPQALRDMMLRLLADPDLTQRIGRQARAYVSAHHSLEQSLDRVVRIVRQAAGADREDVPRPSWAPSAASTDANP